jgi:hypothetical protein
MQIAFWFRDSVVNPVGDPTQRGVIERQLLRRASEASIARALPGGGNGFVSR